MIETRTETATEPTGRQPDLGVRLLVATLLLAVAGSVWSAADDVDLLPAQEAFRFTAVPRGKLVRIEASIAQGYYLYRARISVAAEDAGVRLGTPVMPAGAVVDDPLLGRVEVYRGAARIDVPVLAVPPGSREVRLSLTSQGCADIGICYPPQTSALKVVLSAAALADSAAPGSATQALSRFSQSLAPGAAGAPGAGEFLPVDEAFKVRSQALRPDALVVTFDLAPGYYLYRGRMGFEVLAPASVRAGAADLPAGKAKTDPWLGNQEVYYHNVSARIPLTGAVAGASLTLAVRYQGCADAGLCYPPQEQVIQVSAGATSPGAGPGPDIGALALGPVLDGSGWILGAVTVAALLLAFAPRVLPVVRRLCAIMLLAVVVYLLGGLLPAAVSMASWAALALLAAVVLARAGSSRSRSRLQRGPKRTLLRHAPLAVAGLLVVYAAALAAGAATGARDPLRPLQGLITGLRASAAPPRVSALNDPDAVIADGAEYGTVTSGFHTTRLQAS